MLVFLTVLAGMSLHKRTNSLAEVTKGQAPRLILSGAIISAALLVVGVLLGITVIGIPVSILVLLLPVLIFITGLAVYSHELAVQFSGLENKAPWLRYLTGSFCWCPCSTFRLLAVFSSFFSFFYHWEEHLNFCLNAFELVNK